MLITTPNEKDKTYNVYNKYSIVTIKVDDLPDKKPWFKNAFEVWISKGKSLLMCADSPQAKDVWISQITLTNFRLDRDNLNFVTRIVKAKKSKKADSRGALVPQRSEK